jgi:hypothetical protein
MLLTASVCQATTGATRIAVCQLKDESSADDLLKLLRQFTMTAQLTVDLR